MLSHQLHAQIFKHARNGIHRHPSLHSPLPPTHPYITPPTTPDTPSPSYSPSTSPASSASPPTLPGIEDHTAKIVSASSSPGLAKAEAIPIIHQRCPLSLCPPCGWTKYYYLPDGSGYSENDMYPEHDTGQPEQMLMFDVETVPP
ncbi:hypothetical protein L210DRAFT_1061404 [Boletus edulis BED1]|uniref:Uncharacterized protein n=1 Tax=Boletus edulis BED1 TaxID=1328754 RepID=A0AAD4GJH4_BOLED|nr:hypothetical protein L210DRAFT_1061404 [Boletus edulis BED1]